MPTANANTGNGFSKAVSYALQEQKQLQQHERAVVMSFNNVAGSSRDIGRQMRDIADDRDRVTKPVLHIQINFHPEEKLSREEAQKAVDAILKEIGISKENNQYVVVQHRDKAHDHYHIVANRVGIDGSLVSNERIIERLQVACDKTEQEQGLRRTPGRTVFYDPSQERGFRYATSEEKKAHRAKNKTTIRDKNPSNIVQKEKILKHLVEVLRDKSITTAEGLKQALGSKGIDVRFIENKNGISGVSFKTEKISVKGSQIGAKWGDISKTLESNRQSVSQENKITRAEVETVLKPKLERALSQCASVGGSANIDYLLQNNGLKKIDGGYLFTVKDTTLLINADLEKGIRDVLYQRISLLDKFEERKAYEHKVLAAKPLEIKPVPFLFGKKIKAENAKAEAYNMRLEYEKQKVVQNSVKDPAKERKQLFDSYIENTLKSKITIDSTSQRQKNLSDQIKVQKVENQIQKKSTRYKR